MNGMATSHEHDGLGRVEQVLATYGAVALCRLLDASMGGLGSDGHAYNTDLAMEKIFSQASSQSADATVVAMIYRLLWIIVPQLTYRAVIAGRLIATHVASLGCGLRCIAQHT